jgi:hypothetical protein
MRVPAWVAVVAVVGAALVVVPAAGPARAQPVTVPGPDFDNDGFGDLAVGIPGEASAARPVPVPWPCSTARGTASPPTAGS